MKILLVDDSKMMLQYVGALLTSEGHQIAAVQSLSEALVSYTTSRPEAIVTDFVLEGATGLEVLAAVFSISGDRKPLAVILTQGALTAADQAKAESWGVGVIQKPIRGREDEFLHHIRAWLAASSKP